MAQNLESAMITLLDNITELGAEFDVVARKVLNQEANQILRILRRTSRVAEINGGTYRAGWFIKSAKKINGSWTVEVGNPVEYAIFLEYGHRIGNTNRFWEGDFTLTKATAKTQERLMKRLENVLNNLRRV